jgi:ABC-2 type transport system ATP-binding protein
MGIGERQENIFSFQKFYFYLVSFFSVLSVPSVVKINKMPAIQTDNLTKAFGPLLAVDRLNLEVRPKEIFGLVGPDGSGKTTIMRLFSGILLPTAGEAFILGHSIKKEAERIKDRIGYMSQRFALYGDLTVAENIHFYADLMRSPKGAFRRIPTLSFSNLTPFQDRLAQNLSGGMKQKLGLACALVHTPELLLLDEPTNGVDPVSRRDFWNILYDLLREGVTIFISTAYLDEAERCHRIGLIHQGRLISVGTPAEIKGLLKGELWEIRCSEKMRAHGILKGQPGVRSSGVFGDKVHVIIEREEVRTQLTGLLKDKGIEVLSTRRIPPSLEDVFISL